MKAFLFLLALGFCHTAFPQSPGLIIKFEIDSIKTGGLGFKIEMKLCDPVNSTSSASYFTRDTSTIDFKKLTEKDITCENYISNYNTGNARYKYYFSNQVFAWEKLIIWKISAASRDWKEPMYVILPVKIKSFVTFITVKDVGFEAGKFIWIDEDGKIEPESHLSLSYSLKGRKGMDTDSSTLKKILD